MGTMPIETHTHTGHSGRTGSTSIKRDVTLHQDGGKAEKLKKEDVERITYSKKREQRAKDRPSYY